MSTRTGNVWRSRQEQQARAQRRSPLSRNWKHSRPLDMADLAAAHLLAAWRTAPKPGFTREDAGEFHSDTSR